MNEQNIPLDVFEVTSVAGADSWVFGNRDVSICLTRSGAQMAPVQFYRAQSPIQPYYVAPWSTEDYIIPPNEKMLKLMRGDVFCFPFGFPSDDGSGTYPLHGEVTARDWSFSGAKRQGAVSSFEFSIESEHPAGTVAKSLILVDGENVIYSEHRVSGVDGEFPVGHHPMLAVPESEGSVLIGLGPDVEGHTWPEPFGRPEEPAYAAMAVDASFTSAAAAPTVFAAEPTTPVDSFPRRQGFTDAILWCNTGSAPIAWSTATVTSEGYIWFSLKDPAVLPMTIVFMGNGGRHYPPWNGRERILSLQDVRAYFGTGAVRSRSINPLSEAGAPTVMEFSSTEPTTIRHIQGVARVPQGFGRVVETRFGAGSVDFVDQNGSVVTVPVRHDFLKTGASALQV